jgi:hypothetical protein
VDERGFYVQSKHAAVAFILGRLISVELRDFQEAAIIDGLNIERDHEGTSLEFSSSYGVNGRIKAETVRVAYEWGGDD